MRTSARGFTLLEMMVVVAIFAIVMAIVFTEINATVSQEYELSGRGDLLVQGQYALKIMKEELRESGNVTVGTSSSPPAPSTIPVVFPFFFSNQQPPSGVPYNGYFAAFSYTPPTPANTGMQDGSYTAASTALCYIKPQYDGTPANRTPRMNNNAGNLVWNTTAMYCFHIEKGPDGVNQLVNVAAGGGVFPDGSTRRVLARNVQRVFFTSHAYGNSAGILDSSAASYGVPAGSGDATLPATVIAIDLWLARLSGYDPKSGNRLPVSIRLHDAVSMRNQ